MKTRFGILFLPLCLAMAQTPPASPVFDKDNVHEIRLKFAQPDYWEQLTTNYKENEDNVPYIQASLTWGEYKFDGVGVRFKGNSSYNGATTKKKPFRIKLNEFVKGQKIDGMASFSLSNAWNDPSFVREKPYYEIAAAAGLKAPRSNFAALYINDEYWGLYVLTEVVNGDFLKNYFGKGNDGGNLYKGDIGASFSYLGTDPAAYKNFFEKQSNEEADDWTDLIEFSRIIDQTPVADLPAALDPLLDVDSVLTALALDNLTANLDSYVGMGQNFYIYRRPSDSRWVWIPWDPSLAFGALAFGLSTEQMKTMALEWVTTGGGLPGGGGAPGAPGGGGAQAARPLATKLWQVPAYKKRYREIYQQLVDKIVTADGTVSRMNALRDMIRPYVVSDTQKLVTTDQFEKAMTTDQSVGVGTTPGGGQGPGGPGAPVGGGGGMGTIPGLQPFIEARLISVKAQLAGQTALTAAASPASLWFAKVVGGAAPAAQTISLTLSDATKTAGYAAVTSTPWLAVSPVGGAAPGSLTVSVSAANQAAGSYSGSITVTVPGAANSPIVIPVSLTVTAAASLVANPSSLTFASRPGVPAAPANQAFQVMSTGSPVAYTVSVTSASCGSFLSATPLSGTTPATVTVSVNVANVPAGTCNGTVTVSSTGLAPAIVPVSLTVLAQPVLPVPTISGITNAASYATGAIAPGEVITIFGTNLGPQEIVKGTFSNGKLATTVSGVQVTFNGTPAPILYVRNNQLSVAVPFEVSASSQVDIQVSAINQKSSVLRQETSATAPGVFTVGSTGSGQAAAINQSGSVNSSTAPAPKGSVVAVYITGAGQTNPGATTGALGTATLQRTVAPVLATIGGQPATVTYAGAVPNSLQGLYQINVEIPQSVASGAVPVLFTVGGTATQNTATLVVQ